MKGIGLALLAGCLSVTATAAEFRGYVRINQTISDRLLEPGQSLELGQYVGQDYEYLYPNLLDLLGSYKGITTSEDFRNGTPNALSMLLWHMLFSGLARDVSAICGGEMPKPFAPHFVAHVKPLCDWPADSARATPVLYEVWMDLMGYDAPTSEFEEWRRFMQSEAMLTYQGAEAVEWVVLSTLTNPYFLLGN
jgi:hypothetical protein